MPQSTHHRTSSITSGYYTLSDIWDLKGRWKNLAVIIIPSGREGINRKFHATRLKMLSHLMQLFTWMSIKWVLDYPRKIMQRTLYHRIATHPLHHTFVDDFPSYVPRIHREHKLALHNIWKFGGLYMNQKPSDAFYREMQVNRGLCVLLGVTYSVVSFVRAINCELP